MREMKNSGVAWIGNIPDSWEVKPIRHFLDERIEKNSNQQVKSILSLSAKEGVTLYNGENHSGNKPREDLSDYKIVRKNDIVANSMNILSGSVGLSDYLGVVSPVYYVYYNRDSNVNNLYYLYYLFQCKEFQRGLWGLGNGILVKESESGSLNTIRTRIPSKRLRMQLFPSCSKKEQDQIVIALDKNTKKIDILISNQEQQIEKLKQYKQSLITEVVTKGLNPDVPMKDSGIEWIGKIPNNWQTKKIKYVAKIIDDKYLKGEYNYIALENIESHSARFIKTDSVYDLVGTKMAYSDTVIFGKLRPYLAKVFLVKEITCVNNEFSVFKGLEVTNEYLKYFMLGSRFIDTVNASTYGTKMPRANIGFISNLQITIPPFQEQQNIANYLDDKCAKIDRLIAIKQEKVDKLNDYKKSLIYEYVTGKKEV